MNEPSASIVIATRDRPRALAETLRHLGRQALERDEYEIVVADDGSAPPIVLDFAEGTMLRLVRGEGEGRSATRNAGAEAARAGLLIFLDDDVTVGPEFVAAHLLAQREWPGVLGAGAIRLPQAVTLMPFGRFRGRLEEAGIPTARGLTAPPNLCAAGNMSIPRGTFLELGGFDHAIASGEDQDFALRHTARGGRIAFLPDALGLHRDEALDVRRYCGRAEWGSEHLIAFCRRHPDWKDNLERDRINGPVRWGREPVTESLKKVLKSGLCLPPALAALFAVAGILERFAADGRALDRVYRLLLGLHLFRGYRRGLRAERRRGGS